MRQTRHPAQILGRPLAFGDPDQISFIKKERRKLVWAGQLPAGNLRDLAWPEPDEPPLTSCKCPECSGRILFPGSAAIGCGYDETEELWCECCGTTYRLSVAGDLYFRVEVEGGIIEEDI